ncbi:MAG: DUF2281 domain-containing protein [Treponema sp.]|nr:DUF2281 domain-containing protein [Treponema sp.]
MALSDIEKQLKTIPAEYLTEVYNYLELLQYKILYEKQKNISDKKFPNRRPGILKDPNFYMSPDFDKPLDDFKEYV